MSETITVRGFLGGEVDEAAWLGADAAYGNRARR